MIDPVIQDLNRELRRLDREDAEAEEGYQHPCDVCDYEFANCTSCRFKGTR